jgi:uncharacterized cupredoxin-like copper-binding protein
VNELRARPTVVAAAAVVTLVLAAVSTVALAAAFGAFRSGSTAPNGQCSAPALPGTVVNVELANMGGPMMMSGGSVGGAMRVLASRQEVPHGTVSLRVADVGSLVHELVVLPLAKGQQLGSRTVASDGRVDEAGSVGEASRTCGAGAGDGINPGAISWVTLHLARGDYELICNFPGHYAAGMYTHLRVS